jgi:hypothetical protein
LVALLVVAACSSGDDARESSDDREGGGGEPTVATVETTSPPTRPPLPTAPATVTAPPSNTGPPSPSRLLNENRSLWQREGPDDYSFTYEVQCVCAPVVAGPFNVTVEGDTIVASETPTAEESETAPNVRTIDGLFDLIEASIDDVTKVEVVYDPTLGYPTRIVLMKDRTHSSDDQTYVISNFTPA